jgi:hypothetical protein
MYRGFKDEVDVIWTGFVGMFFDCTSLIKKVNELE